MLPFADKIRLIITLGGFVLLWLIDWRLGLAFTLFAAPWIQRSASPRS